MFILLPPYFDHDAFMHHAVHVLDTPGHIQYYTYTVLMEAAPHTFLVT